jgi:uncharacterized protein YdaU (DUF1376 family)
MHYFQFHIGDYKSHTHHLSLMEDLAYRRLLDHYYLHQSPIKQRDIARQIGMREHEQDVLTVLEEFFVSTDDGYINPRADKEIKSYAEHQATSAFGAFVRTHPELKESADKTTFVDRFLSGNHQEYIDTLKSHHVHMKATSSSDDATTNHKPLTTTQLNTYVNKVDHAMIVSMYHNALPELPAVRMISAKRKKAIDSFYKFVMTSCRMDGSRRAETHDDAIAWIDEYFKRAGRNDFLMCRKDGQSWIADFDFLLTEKGKVHVIEKTKDEQ